MLSSSTPPQQSCSYTFLQFSLYTTVANIDSFLLVEVGSVSRNKLKLLRDGSHVARS
jgi:hypothetical protein